MPFPDGCAKDEVGVRADGDLLEGGCKRSTLEGAGDPFNFWPVPSKFRIFEARGAGKVKFAR